MLLGGSGTLKVQIRMILRLEKPLVLFLSLRYLLILKASHCIWLLNGC